METNETISKEGNEKKRDVVTEFLLQNPIGIGILIFCAVILLLWFLPFAGRRAAKTISAYREIQTAMLM